MREFYQKYGVFVLVALVFYFTFLIIKPYILLVISAAIISYMFYPLKKRLKKKIKNNNLIAIIMTLIVTLIIIVPSIYIISTLIGEIPTAIKDISTFIDKTTSDKIEAFVERVNDQLGFEFDLKDILKDVSNDIVKRLKNALVIIPGKFFNFLMTLFFLFYFFRDGRMIVKEMFEYLPLGKKNKLIMVREFKKITSAVIYGQILTSLVQAIIATTVYLILGVSAPFFWGVLTFFVSFIPMLGTTIAYFPLGMSMIVGGVISSNSMMIIKGIILLGVGFGLISTVDNFLMPYIISDKVKIHPAIIIVGVLGGLTVFGFIGIVLGPLILASFITIFNIYEMRQEMLEKAEESQ